MELKTVLNAWYEHMDGNALAEDYHTRHGTESQCILTNYDDEHAALVTDFLRERIAGKIVVEVGAGIGLLACHLATEAKRVYAIEVDPAWSSTFILMLYAKKPPNLTFIFGKAEEAPPLYADVALFCTHSGRESLHHAAARFAPVVIDVYAELMKDNPKWQELEPLTR
jgi:SAM-dependent methyltransferase